MGFLGIYKALYDYTPQAEGELQIAEGDLLYVLEKSTEDDWWKAKKKATGEDEEEPVGLVPNNYVEEAQPIGKARALYEYTRQTDEELSFPEDAQLTVFDTSDPDWILVGHDGDYGFVPANYIELGEGAGKQDEDEPAAPAPPPLPARTSTSDVQSPPLPARNQAQSEPGSPATPAAPNPAAMIAGMMAARAGSSQQPPAPLNLPPRQQQYASDDSDTEVKSPPLPARPRGDSQLSAEAPRASPPVQHRARNDYDTTATPKTPPTAPLTPGDFHMYNINEMVSIMGKKKKMPTTLGINLRTGIILIAPEHPQDGPSVEWPADRMTHYSREGKHVFMELVRPSKSVDFHAGAKDTAEEIVAMLGELAGAVRAEGLREVIMAGTGQKAIQQKKGVVLYDFMAQGDDEVTVGIGDEVIILDDTKSDEWWMVRRVKNQKEGVVPSSYIEVTGILDTPVSSSTAGLNAGKSTVEQNRLEEVRLTKEAIKAAQREDQRERERDQARAAERSRRENGHAEASGSSRSSAPKSKPDLSKVRTWTDRSKAFTVEAQFLGIKDGKINLHKLNGVRIAVPVAKMSLEDLEYVERITGISLDEDKPLSDLKKRAATNERSRSAPAAKVGATVEPKKPEYDWFQFFLSCDVQPGLCERYAQAFARESMDESVLPDVDASVLRNLGFREGDIIKVIRFLDAKYCRGKKGGAGDEEAAGGLFSGPGGALRNNTRKGRPAPPVETNNTVDPKAFSQQKEAAPSEAKAPSPTSSAPTPASKPTSGFDDDAWDVKPSKTPEPAAQQASAPPSTAAPTTAAAPATAPAAASAATTSAPSTAKLTGSLQELSLLTQPLTPEKVQTPAPAPPALSLAPASAPAPAPAPAAAPAQIPQPTGATPNFFSGLQPPAVNGQQSQFAPQLPQTIARQRPVAPQYTQGQGGLMPPPPPARPLSAPQAVQPSAFAPPPLQPQMTGYPQTQVAPPGQSLNDLAQQRLQQQYNQAMQQQLSQQQQQPMMPMMTGMPQQQGGFQVQPSFMPQPTGMPLPPQSAPPMQAQPTGFMPAFPQQQQQPQMTGLPPPLEPQRTGMPMSVPTSVGMGMGMGMGMGGMGMQQPQQQAQLQPQPTGLQAPPTQPLMPQKTGPPPPVRFGVTPDKTKKLTPQPTGRRANLAAATPDNPFGF
ncbi:173880a0-be7b-4234-b324-d802638cd4b4 [Thermothielavioides terrestris]|uniref:Actin cytoskeleton-regulatory complex protein SLA1 n=1 Tax=Thermothielavioides terrestris TaxID=2587410 RepID=A0A446B9Y8_9PEZI|nr:173880a0-be7b-4234-b324-d802638cd4b4 [Thermothielavioides terrestris]